MGTGVTTARTRALGIGAALFGLVLAAVVVLPAQATGRPNAVRLHMAGDGDFFAYGGARQPITTSHCKVTGPEPLIDLSAGDGTHPGSFKHGLGVKGSGGNGMPCAQVDKKETLTLGRGSALAGRTFRGVRLDVEVTGDAVVRLTLASRHRSATYVLQTGKSIAKEQKRERDFDTKLPYVVSSGPGDEVDGCSAANSSGPNSHGKDNCLWTVMPGFDFDTLSLTTTRGTVSLEGSGDFGGNPAHDTLLYLSNLAPTARDDTFATDEDVELRGDVLANDSDADGQPLTASLLSGPADGSLDLSPDGTFTYRPDPDWSGTDSFTYRASDGQATATARATITVRPVNDAPVGVDSTASTDEDTTVTLTMATDVDSPELTADCTSDGGGTIVDHGDGTIALTPPPDLHGSLVVTCTVTDDHGASTTPRAVVIVTVEAVNDPPVAGDDTAEVDAGSSAVIDVLANDTDVDRDPLSVTDLAAVTPAGASAVANPDGTVTYTPPAGYDGPGGFTYRASDGQATSDVATVDVSVFPVLCSLQTVSDTDGDVTGSFTRLSDQLDCKRYALEAVEEDDTVVFAPEGGDTVAYRGFLTFGSEPTPGDGEVALLLRYDPAGGTDYRNVLWCIDPQFDGDDEVSSATVPPGETWCIASADTRGDSEGGLTTTWQVYGVDDPRFTR